ncbi:MAG: hypothetical protein IIU86_01150 [Oscillospiraceae bacterium]|nr:hypothetical protein [Oscillospiraceae bacterium]
MRVKVAAILCVLFLFSGCNNADAPLDKALALRNRILDSNGCSFRVNITADYVEKVYVFGMDCEADKEGNLTFSVTEPDTIAGITGKITTAGGAITFDDKVLAFKTMADGQITPVTAPWLFINTLRSGYLNGCTEGENSFEISIDDSYEEDALRLNIRVENDLPVFGEIFWQGRRLLTLTVEDFAYL